MNQVMGEERYFCLLSGDGELQLALLCIAIAKYLSLGTLKQKGLFRSQFWGHMSIA